MVFRHFFGVVGAHLPRISCQLVRKAGPGTRASAADEGRDLLVGAA